MDMHHEDLYFIKSLERCGFEYLMTKTKIYFTCKHGKKSDGFKIYRLDKDDELDECTYTTLTKMDEIIEFYGSTDESNFIMQMGKRHFDLVSYDSIKIIFEDSDGDIYDVYL